jgi:hypothetical protein
MRNIAHAGYVAPGNKYKDLPTISLLVVSELVTSAPRIFANVPT